ncbi:MAG: hypothetical protein HY719_07880, partial [Planctomycetes bacterium]|nr:hypothetical protein [Planctomycetota bacterium]
MATGTSTTTPSQRLSSPHLALLLDLVKVHLTHQQGVPGYRALSTLLLRDDLPPASRERLVRLRERVTLPPEAQADPDGYMRRVLDDILNPDGT